MNDRDIVFQSFDAICSIGFSDRSVAGWWRQCYFGSLSVVNAYRMAENRRLPDPVDNSVIMGLLLGIYVRGVSLASFRAVRTGRSVPAADRHDCISVKTFFEICHILSR
jgi:hypothetical protein